MQMTGSAVDFATGGYRFIPAVFQYSGGVAALSGYHIERVRFRIPVPMSKGFAEIEHIITQAGRPLTAFCACELRSPAQFSEEGFRAFNERYVVTLQKWGLFDGKVNPVARSNVCPEIGAPSEPSFYAFSFTAAGTSQARTFVIAGAGDARVGGATYSDRIIRHGETSSDAMRDKARHVLGEMENRMKALGFAWADTTATQVYTIHDLYPFLADEIVRRGAAHSGLTWHYARPPVRGLEYEMDCRAVNTERVLG
jgi:hypothetical protein